MNKYIKIFLLVFLTGFWACEPIEDRDKLENSFDFSKLELEATQSTTGGNEITLKVKTKGVNGFWDYHLNAESTDEVTFIYPSKGKATFTYYVSTPYLENNDVSKAEYLKSKTIEVQIDQIDHELDAAYYKLLGDNLEGKSWVFYQDNTFTAQGYPLFWAMVPPNDPTAWQGVWWNAGDCCKPADVNGVMTFDVSDGIKFTYNDGLGNIEVGNFVLYPELSKLKIKGTNILGGHGDRGNPDGLYDIVMLDENNLALYVKNNSGGTGWTWWFKPLPAK